MKWELVFQKNLNLTRNLSWNLDQMLDLVFQRNQRNQNLDLNPDQNLDLPKVAMTGNAIPEVAVTVVANAMFD